MKIKLLTIGKTDDEALEQLIQKYESRLQHYIAFSLEIIPDLKQRKNLSQGRSPPSPVTRAKPAITELTSNNNNDKTTIISLDRSSD